MTIRLHTHTAARVRGSSLLEVLVSVFVLSVGLLGTAGLQLTSKRANLEARQRVTATALAQDMVERMRANPAELSIYTSAGAGLVATGTTMSAVDCTTECTTAELAAMDLFEWERALAGTMERRSSTNVGGLTIPTACITGPAGGSGTYTVAIAWRGAVALSDPGADGCGRGSGRYDSTGGSQADVHRRLLMFTTFIVVPT